MTTIARSPKAESEADFQTFVIGTAEQFGWTWYHARNPRQDPPGFPDLVLFNAAARRLVVAELKSADGRLSAKQRAWIDGFRAAGVETYVWFPSDRAQVVDVLDWEPKGATLT